MNSLGLTPPISLTIIRQGKVCRFPLTGSRMTQGGTGAGRFGVLEGLACIDLTTLREARYQPLNLALRAGA